MEETIVFIDAGFLSKLSKYFGGGKYIIYDIVKFARNLADKQSLACNLIFYYTAPPFQSDKPTNDELKRLKKYETFKNKLAENSIITIREGRCQRLKIDGNFIYGQKAVDSLMIIDLMLVPLKYKEIRKVIILANDSDFVPVVNILTDLDIKVILYTYYSKKRESSFSRSNELLKVVTRYVSLSKEDFDNAPLNEVNDTKDNYKNK